METHAPLALQLRERSERREETNSPRGRKVPSPLRHAQFRPLAMEYAAEATSPSACKYFPDPLEEVVAGETINPSGYCSAVRTVGYSTVGGKTFMSGKCPHCHRTVKSADQICTPGVTPPTSPWVAMLKSPLRSPRSPVRSPRAGGVGTADGGQSPPRSPARSPLRSPFKGLFSGSAKDKKGGVLSVEPRAAVASPKAAVVSPCARQGRSQSPVRGSGRSPAPWDVPEEVVPKTPICMPARSPLNTSKVLSGGVKGYHTDTRETLRVNVDMANVHDVMPSPRRSGSTNGRSRSLARGSVVEEVYPLRNAASESPRVVAGARLTRSRSPLRSFGKAAQDEQQQQPGYVVRRGGVGSGPKHSRSRSPIRGRSVRGTTSPGPATRGPRSPMHSPYKGSFFDSSAIDADDEFSVVTSYSAEERTGRSPTSSGARAGRSRSPLRSPIRSPFGEGGLRSPLRNPFGASLFGGGGNADASSPRARQNDGRVPPIGSE